MIGIVNIIKGSQSRCEGRHKWIANTEDDQVWRQSIVIRYNGNDSDNI
jgi:hypothetical protein